MGKFTFNFELNNKQNEDGTHNILIRVSKNRVPKRVSTEFNVKKEHWITKGKLKQTVKSGIRGDLRADFINESLEETVDNEKVKIRKFESRFRELTVDEVQASLQGKNYKEPIYTNSELQDLFKYAEIWEKRLAEAKKWGDRDLKKGSINILKGFHTKPTLFFHEIDYDFLNKYKSWLENHEKDYDEGTVHHRLKTIRRFFNMAIDEKIINPSLYPFRLFKLKKPEHAKKVKLKEDQIELIENYKCRPGRQEESRDFSILAFMFQGIRAGDLLSIKCNQIDSNYVSYKTAKGRKDKTAKLYEKSSKIIYKYMRGPEDYLFSFMDD